MLSIELVAAIREAMVKGEHWQQTNDPAALGALIEAWERVFALPYFFQLDPGQQAPFFSMAGEAAQRRYRADRKMDDLNQALAWFRRAVECLPPDAESLSDCLISLGSALHDRYRVSDEPEDLDEAIGVLRQATAHAAPDSSDLARSLSNLGICLRHRYLAAQKAADLDESIEVFRQAAALAAADTGRQTRYLMDLAAVLQMRFGVASRGVDLDELNDVWEHLYRNTGDISYLNNAIQFCATAVQQAPAGSLDVLPRMDALARALLWRYIVAHDVKDLTASIQVLRSVVQCAEANSVNALAYLNSLSNSLALLYAQDADRQVLAEVVEIRRRVAEQTPAGSPDQPGRLNNLGLAFMLLFDRTGKVEDLDEAIAVFQAAVSQDRHPRFLSNLGLALKSRADLVGSMPDLEEAIQVLREAVAGHAMDVFDHPLALQNLAESLRLRQARARSRNWADIEEAVGLARAAVQETPLGSADRPARLNCLGNCLSDRYAYLKNAADLDSTLEAYQEAVDGTPEKSVDLPTYLNNLATAHADRHRSTRSEEDRLAAHKEWRRACQLGSEMMPQEAMRSVDNWSRWAFAQGAWDATAEAYRYGRQILELLLGRQLQRKDKEAWLGKIQGVSASAAYALAKLDRRQEAVAVLEEGRAHLLTEALEQNRHELQRLPELGHNETYVRYLRASERLRRLEQEEAELDATSLPAKAYLDLRHEQEMARDELAAAVAAIRTVQGYEEFLSGTLRFESIRQAAEGSSLIYIVATARGGLALVVRSTEGPDVGAVWLDHLTGAAVREQLMGPAHSPALGGYLGAYAGSHIPNAPANRQAWLAAIENTAGWLWESLMGPVTAELCPDLPSLLAAGASDDSHTRPAAHVVLMPAGLLGLLPLHLAWREVDGQPRYVIDDFVVSYAPSAQALEIARGRAAAAESPKPRLLAIANPSGDLSFTPFEAQQVASYFPGDATSTLLLGEQATQEALVQSLPGHTYLHFACHGRYDPWEVLSSGLLLANRNRLELREILDRSFDLTSMRLVTLSACETGLIEFERLPDEAVGLSAGFLQGGAQAVVSTLWAVNDLPTALLMGEFYRRHLKEGKPLAEAMRGAQLWLRDTTARKMKLAALYEDRYKASGEQDEEALEWMRYCAANPDAKVFAHPYYWAAFVLTGV